MTIVEKAAYLKGMADGLGMTTDTREGKLWAALNELLSSMAHEIEDLQELPHLDMADALDELTDELNLISGADDTAYSPSLDYDDEDTLFDSDASDSNDEAFPAQVLYDLTCPVCGKEFTINEDMLAEGSINCPSCGEKLEFDLSGEE